MILKRYLYKEILQNFLAIFLVLILVVISLRFVRYLGDVAAGKMTAEIIYQLLILKLTTSMTQIIPLCLYLSLFMALDRFQRNNELIALSTAGIGSRFYFSTILKLAAAFTLLLFLLTMFVMPWAETNIDLLQQKANRESDISGIMSGSFKEFSQGNRVLYVEKFNKKDKLMENVFLQIREQGSSGVLTSDTASISTDGISGERTVTFIDGKRYVGKPNQLDFSIVEFQRYAVTLEQAGYDNSRRSSARISTGELLQSLKSNSTENPIPYNELQWRLTTPLSVLLLSAFAIVIVRSSKEVKGSALLITAILIFFVFNNLLNISHDLVNRGKASAFPSLWWPHFGMLAIILTMHFYPIFMRRIKIKKLHQKREEK